MKLRQSTRPRPKLKQRLAVAAATSVIAACLLIYNNQSNQTLSAPSSMNSGQCLSFNGTNSEVGFTSHDLNLSGSTTLTVTAWVKWANKSNAGNWAGIVNLNRNTGTGDIGQFWLEHNYNNTSFEFGVQTLDGRQVVNGGINPTAGTWYHVAGVYDGAAIKLYVNGILQATTPQTGPINNWQGNFELWFGRWATNDNNYRRFNGNIDEVTIWNTALTQQQIRTMMCCKLNGNEAGLAGYWRMDEASGTTIHDHTATARHGIAVNATIAVSGAPIGDASVYTYTSSQLTMAAPGQDSIRVNGFSTTPAGIHIYRIDTIPNTTAVPSGFTGLGQVHYYGVFIVNSSGETYTATYYYNGYPGISNESLLGLVERNNNSILTWSDLSATLNLAPHTLVKTGLTGRHELIIGTKSAVNPLPIELVSFSAEPGTGYVKLDWTTATETNNDHFTIERTRDGVSYERVAEVAGAGNSTSLRAYTAIDKDPYTGTSYYRLKQTDYDGKFEYSPLVSIDYEKAAAPEKMLAMEKVWPSPFERSFTATFNTLAAGDAQVDLYNLNGQLVHRDKISCNEGYNSYEYDDPSLKTGTYILKIIMEGAVESVKLVKM